MINLVSSDLKPGLEPDTDLEVLFKNMYWKRGATELATGKKTLTLAQFEKKYALALMQKARDYQAKNLWQIYLGLPGAEEEPRIKQELQRFDLLANVDWPLAHYRSALRYLQKDPEDIAATGGTNWQKYLPPRFQKIVFFPDLWDNEELDSWGRSWVMKEVFDQ